MATSFRYKAMASLAPQPANLVIQPSLQRFKSRLLPRAKYFVLALFGILAYLLISARSPAALLNRLPLAGPFALLIGCIALWHWLYLRNARITVDANDVAVTGRLGRTRTFSRASIEGVALRAVQWQGSTYPTPIAIGYGPGHRCLFRLPGLYWEEGDLAALKNAVSRRSSKHVLFEPVGAKQLTKDFPGTLALWEREPWLVVLAVATLVVAFIVFGPFVRH